MIFPGGFTPEQHRARALSVELLQDPSVVEAIAGALAVFPTVDPIPTVLCGHWLKEDFRSPTIQVFPGRRIIHVAGRVVIHTMAYPTILGGSS